MSDAKKKEAPYAVTRVTGGLREWKFEWAMMFAERVIDHLRDPAGMEGTITAPPSSADLVDMVRALICASEDFEERTRE